MATGTLVLASDCPTGPREILDYDKTASIESKVKTKYGILLPMLKHERSKIIWIKSIICYLNDSEEKKLLESNGKKRIEDFSTQKAIETWIQLINE